jgi:hypothetical protein
MAIPSITPPAKPVDDAIIDTPWGAWVHDLLAEFPTLQTMGFQLTLSGGGGAKNLIFPEPYPAGWVMFVAGLSAPMVTGNSVVSTAAYGVTQTQVTVRGAIGSYSGTTNTGYITVGGLPPGAAGKLWRYTGGMLRDALRAEVDHPAEVDQPDQVGWRPGEEPADPF